MPDDTDDLEHTPIPRGTLNPTQLLDYSKRRYRRRRATSRTATLVVCSLAAIVVVSRLQSSPTSVRTVPANGPNSVNLTFGAIMCPGQEQSPAVTATYATRTIIVDANAARWTSSDPKVADVANTVSGEHKIRAHEPGRASLIAHYDGATSDAVDLTVVEKCGKSPTVDRLAPTTSSIALELEGPPATIYVNALFTDGTTSDDAPLSHAVVANSNIATATIKGGDRAVVISAVGVGSTTVTVFDGQSHSVPIEVHVMPSPSDPATCANGSVPTVGGC